MIAELLVAAAFTTLVVAVQPGPETATTFSQAKIEAAAASCGVKLRFFALPKSTSAAPLGEFPKSAAGDPLGLDYVQGTTRAQIGCFSKRIPITRIGFISAPPAPKKKN